MTQRDLQNSVSHLNNTAH